MRFSLHATPVELPRYRPEIDGLRAIAILPVVFFHAGVAGFTGGFIGVDVFFVISGYLITAIVARGIAEGDFSFVRFYERRVRRIFPALFFVLACCTVAALLLLPPGRLITYGKSLAAVALFVGNFFFLHRAPNEGYFASRSALEPLLHGWSLSVEEQFYLLLPVALILIHRWARQYLKPALIAAAVCSLGLALWLAPIAAFYLLPARAWELLIGSLLAVGAFPALHGRVQREIAGLVGIASIAAAVVFFDKDTGNSYPYALAPCIGTALIIHASDAGPSAVKRALSIRPLIFLGAISYSLYLWHWPLFFFFDYFEMGRNWQQTTGLVLASLIMAIVSYRWIETPFRGSSRTWSRRRIFLWGGTAMTAGITTGLALAVLHGIPQRFDAATRATIAANEVRQTQISTRIGCWHLHDSVHDVSEITRCSIGAEPRKILFWGDSHLAMLQDSIQRLHDQGALQGRGVLFAVSLACAPTQRIVLLRPNRYCGPFAHLALLRAEESDVDGVFLAFSPWWAIYPASFCVMVDGACQRDVTSPAEIQTLFFAELGDTIATLRSRGKVVIVSLPFPQYDRNIPDVEIHNAMFARFGTPLSPQRKDAESFREKLRQTVIAQGGFVFDPQQVLCPEKQCLYQVDGVSLYQDNNHLSVKATGILDPSLRATFSAALTPAS